MPPLDANDLYSLVEHTLLNGRLFRVLWEGPRIRRHQSTTDLSPNQLPELDEAWGAITKWGIGLNRYLPLQAVKPGTPA